MKSTWIPNSRKANPWLWHHERHGDDTDICINGSPHSWMVDPWIQLPTQYFTSNIKHSYFPSNIFPNVLPFQLKTCHYTLICQTRTHFQCVINSDCKAQISFNSASSMEFLSSLLHFKHWSIFAWTDVAAF